MKLMTSRRIRIAVCALIPVSVVTGCAPTNAGDVTHFAENVNQTSPASTPAVAPDPLKPQEIARRAFLSTVMIITRDKHGQPTGLGSGFAFGPQAVVTNYHVVEGATSAVVRPIGDSREHVVTSLLAADPARDLAVLEVQGLSLPSLAFAEEAVVVGDAVYAVGNPQGLEGTFSQGIVSGVRWVRGDSILQVTAPISPGSSGGPVLDAFGRVVGVATATLRGGQNLNFAVPIGYARAAVSGAGEPQPLGRGRNGQRTRRLLDDFDGPVINGLTADQFIWDTSNPYLGAGFSFSVRNSMAHGVRNVVGVVVFFDDNGQPLTFEPFATGDFIPAGLAVRVRAQTDRSVKHITTSRDVIELRYRDRPRTKVEIRILSFDVAS